MIIHALLTGTPFVYEIFRIGYCIRSKCTSDKYFILKCSTVCKACIIIWQGEPRQLYLPSIPYFLVHPSYTILRNIMPFVYNIWYCFDKTSSNTSKYSLYTTLNTRIPQPTHNKPINLIRPHRSFFKNNYYIILFILSISQNAKLKGTMVISYLSQTLIF